MGYWLLAIGDGSRSVALLGRRSPYFCGVELTVETFAPEMATALKNYERYVVCLDQLPEDCAESLQSLVAKAINAYNGRSPEMRHGIALNRMVTIILSQTDGPRPLCGIYFNLHSPYSKKAAVQGAGAERQSR